MSMTCTQQTKSPVFDSLLSCFENWQMKRHLFMPRTSLCPERRLLPSMATEECPFLSHKLVKIQETRRFD